MKVKEMEVEQRPREKALRYGLESLSDLELVALILQSGNKNRSVFEIASDVLKPVFRGLHHECLEAILRKS